jgi:hypothetical protein
MDCLGVFRCRFQLQEQITDDHFDVLSSRVARYQEVLSRVESGPQRDLVARELSRLEPVVATIRRDPRRRTVELLLGRQSVVLAVPQRGATIPELPINSRDELRTAWMEAIVLSWAPTQVPPAWLWQGHGGYRDGVMNATIGSRRPHATLDLPSIPVGARPLTPFEGRTVSALDDFFFGDYSETRVIGMETVADDRLLIIERFSGEGKKRRVEGRLSLNHQFLPRRIEGPQGAVVDVESYFEPLDGVFYPRRWTLTQYADDDRSAEVRNSRRTPQPIRKHYARDVVTWEVEAIEANLPEPKRFSELGFPEGTYCLDDDKQTYFTVGQPDAVIQALLDHESSPTAPPQPPEQPSGERPLEQSSTTINWLLWLNVGTVGLIFAIIIIRRRGGGKRP